MSDYSMKELDFFSRYTSLLVDYCNKKMGGFDNVTIGLRTCPMCVRRIPAGVPRQMVDTDWLACPACVHRRGLVRAIEIEVYGEGGPAKLSSTEMSAMVSKSMKSAASERRDTTSRDMIPSARKARLEELVDKFEKMVQTTKGAEQLENEKLLGVMKRALDRQRGVTG